MADVDVRQVLVDFRYLHKELAPLDITQWIDTLCGEEVETVCAQAEHPWSRWTSKAIGFLIDQKNPKVMAIVEQVGERNTRQLCALGPRDLESFILAVRTARSAQ